MHIAIFFIVSPINLWIWASVCLYLNPTFKTCFYFQVWHSRKKGYHQKRSNEYSSPSPSSQVAGGCRCASQIDLVIRPGRASGGSSHPPDILNILSKIQLPIQKNTYNVYHRDDTKAMKKFFSITYAKFNTSYILINITKAYIGAIKVNRGLKRHEPLSRESFSFSFACLPWGLQ